MTTATFRLSTPLADAKTKTAMPAAKTAMPARQSLFRRFYDAVLEARMRQAMRELAMHRHLIPQDVLKQAGYAPTTQTTDGVLPFVR